MNTAKPSKPKAPGRAWALSGFLLGAIVSIGFNLQAAWLPADDPNTPEDWAPSIPSQIGAIVWPVALMVSVEVLSRVAWPTGQNRWGALGWGLVRFIGILAVAGGSGVISYGHIHEVLTAWKYGDLGAAVGPLVIDGLMLISGFALVSIGRAARAVDTAQAAVDESPAVPARTDSARRPQVPPQAGDEPHAVSPDTPHTTPGETAPEPPAASPVPAARIARPRMQAAARTPARRPAGRSPGRTGSPTPGDGLSDDQVIARLRDARDPNTGDLPTESWMRKHLGVGQSRAARLRKEAARPDLHTVKTQEVAVG